MPDMNFAASHMNSKHPNMLKTRIGFYVLVPLTIFALAGCNDTYLPSVPQKNTVSSTQSSTIREDCGDLLTQYGMKPEKLEFVSCETVHMPQVSFIAHYKVIGEYALLVEEYLHEHYRMNKLTFACCGWEPEDGGRGYLEVPGHYFSINMHLDEITMNDRTKWNELPFFYVDVEELVDL